LDYKIVNRVAIGNMGSNLDLFNMAVALSNVEYEPEQFPGAIMRLKEPKMTITLFKNGKINCAGAAKDSDIPKGIVNASKILHEILPEVKILKDPPYKIVNIVANAFIDRQIDLFELAVKLDNVEYEPEQFPGAIVRLYDPNVSLLLFKNGKLICAGAKSEDDVEKSLIKITKIIHDIQD